MDINVFCRSFYFEKNFKGCGILILVTILTPTYNRVHTLQRLYESLEEQSDKSFQWLVVDDGSTDETKELINTLSVKSSFKVEYVFKENGGKHTAINLGVEEIDTPLVFIVDSDDYLIEDAIEVILNKWSIYRDDPSIGSFWYLISDPKGKIIGEEFPENEFVSTYLQVMINQKVKGDKKAVYLTKARKEFPFPVYKEERFLGESTVHTVIGEKYKSVFINKVIYIGEYLKDGLSVAGLPMRIKNPLGGMLNSKKYLSKKVKFPIRFKKTILFITYGFLSGKQAKNIIMDSGLPFLTTICMPFGYSLYLYWGKKYRE